MTGKNTQRAVRALAILLALAWFLGLGLILLGDANTVVWAAAAGFGTLLVFAAYVGGAIVAALLSRVMGAGHGCLWPVLAFIAPGIALPIMALWRVRLVRAPDVGSLHAANDLPALFQALHCRQPAYVRAYAGQTLAARDSGEVMEPLLRELASPDSWARAAAANAIAQIVTRPDGAAFCGEAAGPLLAALTDADPETRAAAAVALGQIGDPRATSALLGGLRDRDPFVRRMTAQALGRAGDAQAVAALAQSLSDDPVPEVQRQAALALGRICSTMAGAAYRTPAVAALIDRLHDRDASVRKYAAESLGMIRDPQASEAILVLLSDRDAGVRAGAALALGRVGDQRAAEPLSRLLQDPDAGVQHCATVALADLNDVDAAPPSLPAPQPEAEEPLLLSPDSTPDVPARPTPASDPNSTLLPSYPPSAYSLPAQTSRLAIASLAAGIVTWLLLPIIGAVIAVATGHLAKRQIRQESGQLSGTGLATAGLVMGYAQLALVLFFGLMTGLATNAERAANPPSSVAAMTPRPTLAGRTSARAETGFASPENVASTDAPVTLPVALRAQTPATLQIGHWAGDDISFDVGLDGNLHNFELSTWIGTGHCRFELGDVPVNANDEILIISYMREDDYWPGSDRDALRAKGVWPTSLPAPSEDKVERLRISGRFMGTGHIEGTYHMLVCGEMQMMPGLEKSWNASAAEGDATPTSTPTLAPTPSPTATPVPTTLPTPTSRPVSLAEALDQGLADIQILGRGGASGDSIVLIARPLGGRWSEIKVQPGTVLRSSVFDEQDMVVRRLLGLRIDERTYRPANTIFLPGFADAQTYAVEAFCLNFHKNNPSTTTAFTVGDPASPAIAAILDAVNQTPGASQDIDAIQAAIWTVTDDVTWAEMAERGYSPDQEMVRSILLAASLDPNCTALFGGSCTPTLQASSAQAGAGAPPARASLPTQTPRATTAILDAQVQKLFAPGPSAFAVAVDGDTVWIADNAQRRIHHLDQTGAPLDSFPFEAEGEVGGLAWDGEALTLLVSNYSQGNQLLRLTTDGNVLDRFPVPVQLQSLTWDPADQAFWVIPSQADGFVLQLNADGSLRSTLPMPVFGGAQAIAWAPDGLWVLNVFGTWHRFTFDGSYLASAELPVEVFASNPALSWDPRGYLWLSVPGTREIYQYSLREAAVDAELPPGMQSPAQRRAEGQLPLPPVAFQPAQGSGNAIAQVVNDLPDTLAVALDGDQGGAVHESAVLAPGESWSAIVPQGGVFTLFLSANAAPPVAYSDKVLLLPGYEYTWTVGDAIASSTATPTATSSAITPTATPAAIAPTPTATPATPTPRPPQAAPTRTVAPTKPPAPPPAACPNPQARITSPANGAAISGITPFLGTANLDNLEYYKFEYKPADSPTWQYLTQVDATPVTDGKLMDFYTTTIAPGVYDFRLIVVDRSGNYPQPCELRLTVQR